MKTEMIENTLIEDARNTRDWNIAVLNNPKATRLDKIHAEWWLVRFAQALNKHEELNR